MAAPKGFHKLVNKPKQAMDIADILSAGTEPLLTTITYHAALVGAYFSQTTNRSKTAVKWTIMLKNERVERWANTPEEALEGLYELSEALVEEAIEAGLVKRAV